MVFPADFTAVGVAASAGESAGDDAEDAPVEAGCEGEPTEDVRLGLFEGQGVVASFPAGVEVVVPPPPVRSSGDAAGAPDRVSAPDPGLLAARGTVLAASLRLGLMAAASAPSAALEGASDVAPLPVGLLGGAGGFGWRRIVQ